jgi:predicted AAA+ superfamily ATPase
MIERVGKKISYSKLARLVGIGNDAVKRYVSYFEDAFLIHTIEQKGTQNERKYGPKKCYAPDNGICSVFSESIGTGALAENCVYLELKKSCEPVYVDRNNLEVDFLCGKDAYEVKYKDNLGENDVKGLTAIAQKGLKNKWLITKSVHTTQGDIVTIPLWKFLLKP